MQCPRCQAPNDEGARFCEECGARLGLACPACGEPVGEGKKFCRACGAALGAGPGRRAPQIHTPGHLAEKILATKRTLEGGETGSHPSERKLVTVLFADLKGSMELLADRDPEEARKLLDPVLERMMEAVHHYEGTVNQVMGDGIMALFGAPLAHEDHAVRACYAALRMQAVVKQYAEEVRRRDGVLVHIRVGLNSGEVVVRSIGNDLHVDYTAVGQTTHLAARMEQMAMPGTILITARTLAFAEGYVEVEPLGPIPVKGLAEPVEAHEVKGAGPVRTRLQASAARGLTRFVGRTAEVEQLGAALEQARRGTGQVVAVVGEPGVGKSRLFHEFLRSRRFVRARGDTSPSGSSGGWLVLESSSVSYGKATAYLPVLDLLRGYFRIEARDDTRTIREKVAGKVLMLDRALEDVIAPVLTLLDALPDDSPFRVLDPPQQRQRTQQAIKRVLQRESQVQPLLLVFEDLHWIDSETQAFLDGLVESLPAAPVLLLVNYRPEYQHGWGSRTYYRQLRIDPLGAESAEELLQALLGDDSGLSPLRQLLIERAEGNPFFLEECVRTLVETEMLAGTRGAYRLAKAPQTIRVPASVEVILAARIDRLAPEDKQLLQTAAVVGKDVPSSLLVAIAQMNDEAVRRGLAHLQLAEFLYETRLFPELEYTFKHALTHEVAYGSLLSSDGARSTHGSWKRSSGFTPSGCPSTWSSSRTMPSGPRRGRRRCAICARPVRERGHAGRTRKRQCYEQALVALGHLPEGRITRDQAIDVRLALRMVLVPLGDFEKIAEHLRMAEADALALDDESRLARVLAWLSECSRQIADHDRAEESGERACRIATTLGNPAVEIAANFQLALNCRDQGAYRRALDLLQRNAALLEEGSVHYPDLTLSAFGGASSLGWLAWCHARLGEFDEGIRHGADAVQNAETTGAAADAGNPLLLATAYNGLGALRLFRGEVGAAIPLLERGLELCHTTATPFLLPWLAATTGLAYALAGRLTEALPLLEQGVSTADSLRLVSSQSLRLAWLGEAHLLAGQPDRATEAAERALALARGHKERGNEAQALWLLGEVAARRDAHDLEPADFHYREALALAEALEMRPLVAHCHLGLGSLYRRATKPERAREHLSIATGMLRDMGMAFWLRRAEAK